MYLAFYYQIILNLHPLLGPCSCAGITKIGQIQTVRLMKAGWDEDEPLIKYGGPQGPNASHICPNWTPDLIVYCARWSFNVTAACRDCVKWTENLNSGKFCSNIAICSRILTKLLQFVPNSICVEFAKNAIIFAYVSNQISRQNVPLGTSSLLHISY